MAKVTIDAYRTVGRPFRTSIEENATEGATVGLDLVLGQSVTLLSGAVLPAGYVLQPIDILNGLIEQTDGQGAPSDWSLLTSIPANVTAVANLSTVGLVVRQTGGTWTTRGLVQPAAGISITNADGDAGAPTFALANDLAAIESLASTGIAVRTNTDTWVTRAITAGTAITVTNGDGVAGAPTVAHADTSSVADLNSNNSNGVFIQDFAVTFDTFGHVQTVAVVTADAWASPVLTGNPTAPTAAVGDNDTSVATTAFVGAAVPNASYRSLLQANSIITAGSTAGTYALTAGGDGCILSGANTAFAPQSIYIDSADYPTVNGATTKLRIRVQLYTNDVAPTGNYTFGLYPIIRPATSGGSGVNIYTIGTVVSGSNGATFTAPVADGLLNAVGSDFALPANGHYVLGVVTTATVAANSNIQLTAYLQMRNA